ncbi:pilus assembly PilX family protein [Ramlibacter humi]|uniref:Pilus assembly protein PilX n=1 Tax=Ramlibacter humi TaxID=2530451 RepID=A0A4Z0BCS0_9BURK|nr:hypothetical protein [Ramlibacter humi]TFY97032.1 hypothetical protein EZ216_19400 [Ramlibacter humi]
MKAGHRNLRLRRGLKRAQQGISLLFTIIALVVVMLTALAVTHSIDTSAAIVGNLSFRQDALMASNVASEQAVDWLRGKIAVSGALEADLPNEGYYATSRDQLDVTGTRTTAAARLPVVNWDGACLGLESSTYLDCTTLPFTPTSGVKGNKVQWVITRLCGNAGAEDGLNPCARPPSDGSSGGPADRSEPTGAGRLQDPQRSPYYRILVRVQGARNSVTYTETLVHF